MLGAHEETAPCGAVSFCCSPLTEGVFMAAYMLRRYWPPTSYSAVVI